MLKPDVQICVHNVHKEVHTWFPSYLLGSDYICEPF